MRVGLRAGFVVATGVLALALAGPSPTAAAGPRFDPLPSPAPGSPIFVSFSNRFEDSLSATLFDIVARGSDLTYIWLLQNYTCGAIGLPESHDAKNSYVHPGCPISQEIPVRVSVLVVRKSDLDTGALLLPKAGAAYFIYSQVARAADGDPATATVPPAPQLQYFGPTPSAQSTSSPPPTLFPTTTSRPATAAPSSTGSPGGGGGLPLTAVVIGGIAAIGAGTLIYRATRPPRRVRQGNQIVKYECSLHVNLDPQAARGGMGHANANLRKTITNLDGAGNVIDTTSEETVYDFAPKGNAGLFAVLLGGTPGKVIRNRARGGGEASNWYQEITQEGYDKGKAWADGSVSAPPTYRGATYNCCDYARQVCTEAGGTPPSAGTFVSTPEDMVDHIKTSAEGLTPQGPAVGEDDAAQVEGH